MQQEERGLECPRQTVRGGSEREVRPPGARPVFVEPAPQGWGTMLIHPVGPLQEQSLRQKAIRVAKKGQAMKCPVHLHKSGLCLPLGRAMQQFSNKSDVLEAHVQQKKKEKEKKKE